MGFLETLFGAINGNTAQPGIGRHRLPRTWWKVEGFVALATGGHMPVVGESNYQDTFEAIVGQRWTDGVYWHVVVQLVFIDDNPHDANAVGVLADGKPAGFIPRDRASALRQSIIGINPENRPVICKAEITGGFVSGSKRASYGLTLDVAEPLRARTS